MCQSPNSLLLLLLLSGCYMRVLAGVLTVLRCCICLCQQDADTAVEDLALGLIAPCCSVQGVQGTSMAYEDHTLTCSHTPGG